MNKYPFIQVDAFTQQPLGGNPCAIVFEADNLSDEQMLAIAKETNLSETVFVLTPEAGKSDFKARYFTPLEEIPLAGHPTISLVHALVELGKIDKSSILLELPAGIIRVDIANIKSQFPEITMFQKKPIFQKQYDPKEVMPLFNLSANDLLEEAIIQTVSTGTPQLMIPVKDLGVLKKAEMDISGYRNFKEQGDFFSPHLFCLTGVNKNGNTFARHFGLPPDTFEDPFTGSATGNMACFLWYHKLISNPKFIAQQGHWMKRPGEAVVEVVVTPENIETVKLTGTAITILEGTLKL